MNKTSRKYPDAETIYMQQQQHTSSDCKAYFADEWYKHSDFCPKVDPNYGKTFKRHHCSVCGEYDDDPDMPCCCQEATELR